jgi:hypothetical protein
MQPATNNTKKIVITAILILGLAISYVFMLGLQRIGKTAVKIDSVPGNLVVMVNDEKRGGSTVYLSPGTYEITAKKEGFSDYSESLTISEGQPPKTLFIVLSPDSESARKWAQENRSRYLAIEKRSGEEADKQGAKFVDDYPIVQQLPHRGSLYNIDYSYDEETSEFKLQITSPDALGRQVAVETIKNWGYEPTDYVVEFLDYTNPFVNLQENSDE